MAPSKEPKRGIAAFAALAQATAEDSAATPLVPQPDPAQGQSAAPSPMAPQEQHAAKLAIVPPPVETAPLPAAPVAAPAASPPVGEGSGAEAAKPRAASTPRPAKSRPVDDAGVVLPRPIPGRAGRLEAYGEPVVKTSLEVAEPIVRALDLWERDETKRTGERAYRERVIDLALSLIPESIDKVIAQVGTLSGDLRSSKSATISTRLRSSVRARIVDLRPELRLAGAREILLRDVYTVALHDYLQRLSSGEV